MQRTLLTALASALLLSSTPVLAHTADKGNYKIDAVHSNVHFTLTHLGVSNFTGRFDKVSGQIVADGTGAGNKVVVDIDTQSVNTNFAERDKHIRSPDFLNAAQYPVAHFESSSVTFNEDGSGSMQGNLTLRGVTKPVSFQLKHIGAGKDPWGGYRSGYVATGSIPRSAFGISFLPGGLGENVELVINLEGIRQ